MKFSLYVESGVCCRKIGEKECPFTLKSRILLVGVCEGDTATSLLSLRIKEVKLHSTFLVQIQIAQLLILSQE